MSADLPPLRDVIARHDLGAKKALGQHFLLDLNLTRKIARAAEIGSGDVVLEIGPGPGGLTRALLDAGAHVVAVERDARCLAALQELGAAYPGALAVIEGDALTFDERAIAGAEPMKIVANLPYNISTELLIKWLRANCREPALWRRMALMFQKEVADRILAAPGSKTYGRLSVIAQAASRPTRAFDLPARAFTPPPKVDSSVVVFAPAAEPVRDIAAIERVTQAAFSQRRKMLRVSLKALWGAQTERRLAEAGVRATDRAENVSVAQYLALAR
ncbi:MAG: 16S rRNA (adenine(1518)-N(6)/adenine(1519)-N(6))-dimethyltransferase RsmA [Alphaproteobacteria bacterium]|nr:16S rRNA (adenine(1518)-N(6)/adenine(1519)-N(6))-dimethyltransferase RsmA [Alphaproteobacteria bacterium]